MKLPKQNKQTSKIVSVIGGCDCKNLTHNKINLPNFTWNHIFKLLKQTDLLSQETMRLSANFLTKIDLLSHETMLLNFQNKIDLLSHETMLLNFQNKMGLLSQETMRLSANFLTLRNLSKMSSSCSSDSQACFVPINFYIREN